MSYYPAGSDIDSAPWNEGCRSRSRTEWCPWCEQYRERLVLTPDDEEYVCEVCRDNEFPKCDMCGEHKKDGLLVNKEWKCAVCVKDGEE